ncbi:AMP-dependent synthetase/ligase [Sabulicella glaciei]|uniref:Long-chain fatty acid--CoA ligase n=1 Tax=Sabulicella glaciei TaxID=2984948 RepID=A0ABT3NU07_9PROT|nr:long-chain fatty acid--CoA ligase [Roseococcus sp. MDT2-1-1]MCW8085648.1 long-chain fatty acid--CoA ligase [Roseococcus sp. MDT2-1-1]
MARGLANATSLPRLLLGLTLEDPGRPMLGYWRDGAWRRMARGDFAQAVADAAAGLRAQGVTPGDRVVLVAENRPEFMIADNAVMAVGAVTVPTYVTNTVADHAHILRDSGARAAIVSTPALAARLRQAGELDLLVCMDDAPAGTLPWAELTGTHADAAALIAEVEQIPEGRLACLVYTSGTGGTPRGVMLPHRALLANCRAVSVLVGKLLRMPREATYLSFLPMSHSYEHTVGGFIMPSAGAEVVFSRGADRLAQEFAQHRPHIITAVPRLFEVLRERITAQVEKAGGLRATLFRRALALGLRRLDGPKLGWLERLEDAALDRLVRNKVRDRFGGRLEALVSGGARLDPALSGFFLALGIPVIQGYGQTEAGPVISVNLPWDNDRRSVGRPLHGVEARLGEDGELLVRGALVMDGYWNNPAATESALREGWLHTGDVAEMRDGRIYITDRKRDFIKLKGGDMVAPAKIEALLAGEPEIAQAVAAGEGLAGMVALVVPAEGREAEVEQAIRRVNGKLSPVERIRRHAVLPEPFTVENGLMTPTMKVKRRQVLERHGGLVESLAS